MHTGPDRLITGGYDGKVRMWSSPDLDLVGDFDMNAFTPYSPIISSVCLSHNGDTILVANEGCELFEISAVNGSNVHGDFTSVRNTGAGRVTTIPPSIH